MPSTMAPLSSPAGRRSRLMRHLPFSAATTPLQGLTYLLGICLFSISFLVFLNSSLSFVVTDLIGVKHGVGDIVGTLGFVDELVALVACPAWGLVSDRLGVRNVAVAGFGIIGLALALFVQAQNVYPQLLLARIFFALGATASATMVTAILPSLTADTKSTKWIRGKPTSRPRDSLAVSVDSELTITPESYSQNNGTTLVIAHQDEEMDAQQSKNNRGGPSALAGYVGLFTGCGALLALALFLPLPARFGQMQGVTLAQAVEYSFYVVGGVALAVAVAVFFGLRALSGEEGKGWRMLLGLHRDASHHGDDATLERHHVQQQQQQQQEQQPFAQEKVVPYWHLLKDSIKLGLVDSHIALGYIGGFVARASSVAISLFVPLFVNAFFIRNGFCQGSPNDPSPELKKECRQAYVLASILTGVANLVGLVCAPLFGYLSSRMSKQEKAEGGSASANVPVYLATLLGIVGYVLFPQLPSPEFRDVDGRGGTPLVFLCAALIGFSQIGAIVCSLGSLGRGVLKADVAIVLADPHGCGSTRGGDGDRAGRTVFEQADGPGETAPLLEAEGGLPAEDAVERRRLKGSVAGVYSWCGGAAILLLTKLGGYLFDVWSTGAPFYMMAVFNGMLLLACVGIDLGRMAGRKGTELRSDS